MIFYQTFCRVCTFCHSAQTAPLPVWTIYQTLRLGMKYAPPRRSEVIKNRGPSWVTRTEQRWWWWHHQILQAGLCSWAKETTGGDVETKGTLKTSWLKFRQSLSCTSHYLESLTPIVTYVWPWKTWSSPWSSPITRCANYLLRFPSNHIRRSGCQVSPSSSSSFTSLRPSLPPSISPGIRSDWR